MYDIRSDWPRLLFIATLCIGFFFLTISSIYLLKTSSFAYNRQLFDQLRSEYDRQITDLSNHLLIQKTITQTIPTPTFAQQCISMPFGQKVCTSVPHITQQSIPTVITTPDPEVQKKIDELRSKLSALSAESEASQASAVDFKPIYDFVQNMMRPLISLIVLLSSLFVILSNKYKSDVQKWAFGSLGTVLGFWLK